MNVARQYFASQGRQIDPIKLYGAMELAPIVGLADVIVDVVDTGNTLKANGLEARDLIAYSSARLVVSRVAMKTRHQHICPIIERLNEWVKLSMQLKPVTLATRDDNFDERLTELTAWESVSDLSRQTRVAEIIQAVRSEGDEALLRLTRELDQHQVKLASDLVLDESDLEAAFHGLSPDLKTALTTARDRIWTFHEAQKESSWRLPNQGDGIVLGQEVRPMSRVGLYVPGGKATYPSSVLMNAIPAKVAGVSMVQMVVPAPKGELNPVVLAAAYLAEVDRVVTVGGAQAIAALAYGTASVLPVDKIVGPR